MDWRLSLDLGTNSIGWWAFRLTTEKRGNDTQYRIVESLDGGVRIFSDGREPSRRGRVGDSRAVERRTARSIRRNRDRGQNRVRWLVHELIRLGLLPESEEERAVIFGNCTEAGKDPLRWNPYRLRAAAVERRIEPYELGRALAHLGRRRGFKSNRKAMSNEDGGALAERIETLCNRLGGQTLGQFLWSRFQEESGREARGGKRRGLRFRGEDDFYPDRSMYAEEFDAIREAQSTHHVSLLDADWNRLRAAIVGQRPLKPVQRGACEFFLDEPRHWKDSPIAEDFRLFQEVNNLRWVDADERTHLLDPAQRQAVLDTLLTRKSEIKFASLLKLKGVAKRPMFPDAIRFNLEGEKRKGLKAHRFAARFLEDEDLAPLWQARNGNNDRATATADGGRLDDIFDLLHGPDETSDIQAILKSKFTLSNEAAEKLVSWPLGSVTASVSRRFMERIVPILRDQGLEYWDAVGQITDDSGNALHHSLRDDGRVWPRLPYYGAVIPGSTVGGDPVADIDRTPEEHFGRIANPTVHVALNQVRRVVNNLVSRFGCGPRQIHVEVTRELKLPKKKREEIERQQAANERENERIRTECKNLGLTTPSPLDLRKWKLWEELGKNQVLRRCVFTNHPISAAQLFNGEVEIEHILPFSRTLDNGMANLTLSFRWANRLKGNNTPFEAFGANQHADKGIRWEDVAARAQSLLHAKRWRFGPNAMERFEREQDFIARQLTDTAYIARVATRYLKALEGVDDVVANPGRLTAMVRGKWGFNGILSDDNRKIRTDHRHHAVDAAVVGLIDRALLQRIARNSARGADDVVHLRLPEFSDIAAPDVHAEIRARVPDIVVTFKPDHGLQGKYFTDTAYGVLGKDSRDTDFPEHGLVARMAVAGLTPKQCETIRDPLLRKRVHDHLMVASAKGQKHEEAMATFARDNDIRRARVLVKDQTATPILSAPYKAYTPAAYAFCDVWRVPKGRKNSTFQGVFWTFSEVITAQSYTSGQPDKVTRKPHPAAKFIARLFKDDMIAFAEGGVVRVARVAGFSTTDNKLDIQPHHESGTKKTRTSINVLGTHGLRKITVSPDGRVRDAGA